MPAEMGGMGDQSSAIAGEGKGSGINEPELNGREDSKGGKGSSGEPFRDLRKQGVHLSANVSPMWQGRRSLCRTRLLSDRLFERYIP